MTTTQTGRPPVLFAHGLCLTPRIWNHWKDLYKERGYECVAPPWPGRSEKVEAVRQYPDPLLGELTFDAVFEHYVGIAEVMPEKPIVIGHSLGGLIAQLLVVRGLAVAGVAIDSVPPQGILTTEPSFFIRNWAVLNPFKNGQQPYMMPFEAFQSAFANDMSLKAQRQAYDRHIVPESLNVAKGALSNSARIDFDKEHAPLLFIAGDNDHTIPPGLSRRNYERSRDGSVSISDFQLFGARNHYEILCGRDWQLVADAAIDWAERRVEELAPAQV